MATTQSRMTRTKTIALLGLMLALTIIFCFAPIKFGLITIALMIVPTLIVAQVCDFKTTLAMSLLMSVLNLIAWYTIKAGEILAPVFQNPIVCIVPRVLLGVVAYWSRRGLEFLILKKGMKIDLNPQPVVVDDDEDTVDEEIMADELADASVEENSTESAKTSYENSVFDTPSVFCDENDVSESVEDSTENDEDAALRAREEKKAKRIETAKVESARQATHLLSTALGVITNTLFVGILTVLLFNGTRLSEERAITPEFIGACFATNFIIEVVCFPIIVPPLALAIRAAKLV
ncbi:MAG: ECF transporter S component [Clostridia bacterium]|nr:ECF transporter S component [Clostridia bacterium]